MDLQSVAAVLGPACIAVGVVLLVAVVVRGAPRPAKLPVDAVATLERTLPGSQPAEELPVDVRRLPRGAEAALWSVTEVLGDARNHVALGHKPPRVAELLDLMGEELDDVDTGVLRVMPNVPADVVDRHPAGVLASSLD